MNNSGQCTFSRSVRECACVVPATATAHGRLFLEAFFGGWQNIKKREVFAAARQDVGPFFFYLDFIFWLLF
jgi:hypothetical protein